MRRLLRLNFALLLFATVAYGAALLPILTPDEAVRLALEHNYGIVIARNDAQIARLNNTSGNAGMLPYASIIAAENFSVSEPPLGGTRPKTAGWHTNTMNLVARIDWTMFDGGRMFIARNRLMLLDSLGGLRFRATVMQTQADVLTTYYNVVRQKQQLVFINEVLALNQERLAIAQTSYTTGLVPKTVVLQAMIDLNENRTNVIWQQRVIDESKRALNVLLSRADSASFDVIDTIALLPLPDHTALRNAVDSSNIGLKILQRQFDIAELNLRESRALLLPKLAVNAVYGLTGVETNSGASGIAYGPQLGASLTVPLFQGGNGTRQVLTSSLTAQSALQQLTLERNNLTSRVGQLLEDFKNQRQLLAIEQENTLLAKENLDISMQQLRLGQSTMIELRLAEESYANSRTRLLGVRYSLKMVETTLRLLMARL